MLIEELLDTMAESYYNSGADENPEYSLASWKLIHIRTLLENILIDFPSMESYYKDFIAQMKLL